MESKILLRAIIIGVLAVIVVTGVAVNRLLSAGGPPKLSDTTGQIHFKPAAKLEPVPPIEFTDANGKKVTLADFKGKMVLLNIWATWCVPCVEELPSIDALMRSRDNDHFVVLTVSEDRGGKIAVDKFFLEHQLSDLPRDVDTEQNFSRSMELGGLPTTVLIDAEGRELGRIEGGVVWNGPDAGNLLDYYVAHDPGLTPAKG